MIRIEGWRGPIAGAAVALAVMTAASPARAAPSPSADERAVRAAAIEWMQALERKDDAALERIVAADFRLRALGQPASTDVSRATWLANARKRQFSGFDWRNMVVEVDGDQATTSAHLTFHASPIPFALTADVHDEWVRRDGRWQVRSRWLGHSGMMTVKSVALGVLAGIGLSALFVALRRRRRRRA